jgi:hypothetical protein
VASDVFRHEQPAELSPRRGWEDELQVQEGGTMNLHELRNSPSQVQDVVGQMKSRAEHAWGGTKTLYLCLWATRSLS